MTNGKIDTNKVLEAIYGAFDEVNETLPEDSKVPKSSETRLLGEEGAIDSLGLTILIVAIERKIEEGFAQVITLVNEQTMSEDNSPFVRVSKLVEYISALLEEKINA